MSWAFGVLLCLLGCLVGLLLGRILWYAPVVARYCSRQGCAARTCPDVSIYCTAKACKERVP